LLVEEATANILKKHMPQLFEGAMLNFMSKNTLRQVAENAMTRVSQEAVEAVLEDLAKV
jgi:hypothetical protein